MTAGFLKEKSLVEIFDLIFFPTVPFTYISPSVVLVTSLSFGFNSGLRSVNSSPYSSDLTLNFSQGNAFATASIYHWYRSTTISGGGYTEILPSVSSDLNSRVKTGITFSATVPVVHSVYGTVDHQAGTPQPDSSGTPQPGAPVAGTTPASNVCNMTVIFPYYYGTVSSACLSIDGADIIGGNEMVCRSTAPLSVDFNSSDLSKGFLAIPKGVNIVQPGVSYSRFFDQNDFEQPIPGGIFPTGPSDVGPVTINGVSHTYSVYLFNYGSETLGTWKFCT